MSLLKSEIYASHQKLHFITGKGGVGKTMVSCALSYNLSCMGKKTLLLSINPSHGIEENFSYSEGSASGEILHIKDNLWVCNLDEQILFDKFIKNTVKIRSLYDMIRSSPVYKYFSAVAPGIKELICQEILVKSLEKDAFFNELSFDKVVIDSPATGHGMSWFAVVDSVLKAFPGGPLYSRATKIKEVFSDGAITSIHLVTLPEEMPVNETIEYYSVLKDKLNLPVKSVFLNSLFPDIESSAQSIDILENVFQLITPGQEKNMGSVSSEEKDFFDLIKQSGLFYVNRRKLNKIHRQKLIEHIPLPLIEIPFYFETGSQVELVHRIGDSLLGESDRVI